MTLTIARETLFHPLQMVIGAVERRHTLPILSHVLIQVQNQQLKLSTSDLEVEISATVNLLTPTSDQVFTVPGRKLYDICKSLPEEAELVFSFEPHKVLIKANKSRFNLSCLSAESFPLFEEEATLVKTEFNKNQLLFLLEKTYFAMAQQDVRYFLNGLMLECSSNKITAVSADGHRMALAWLECPVAVDNLLQVIVPRKGISELMRLLGAEKEECIVVSIGTHHIQFSSPQFSLRSKLIDGKFPDYKRALPKAGNRVLSIDKLAFKALLQRLSVLLDKNRSIVLDLSPNHLRALVSNAEQEGAEEELALDYEGEPFSLGFNITYLLDVIQAIESPVLTITATDSKTAILIEDSSNTALLFLIMPMQL